MVLALMIRAFFPINILSFSRIGEGVPKALWDGYAEADASQKKFPSCCSGRIRLENRFRKKRKLSCSAATALESSRDMNSRPTNSDLTHRKRNSHRAARDGYGWKTVFGRNENCRAQPPRRWNRLAI